MGRETLALFDVDGTLTAPRKVRQTAPPPPPPPPPRRPAASPPRAAAPPRWPRSRTGAFLGPARPRPAGLGRVEGTLPALKPPSHPPPELERGA